MSQKYIFLDVDGTLFDPKTRRIPDSTLSALKKAKKKGHKLFICTGRSHSETLDIKKIGIAFDGFICSAGAVVEINNEIVCESFIEPEDIRVITASAQAKDTGYVLEGTKAVFLDAHAFAHFETVLQRDFGDDLAIVHEKMRKRGLFPLSEYKENDERSHICKISLLVRDPAMVAAFREELSEKFNITTVITYDAAFLSVEINLKEISKATGVQKVLDYFGADWADTIAYGDSMNDLEMLKCCHIGVCMDNGDARLKEAADDITTACDRHGIYISFEKYGLI